MATESSRDLLAERIRRLERQIAETNDRVAETGRKLDRAASQLDALVDLVGRLGKVIDVQGTTLHGDEHQLARKVEAMDRQVAALAAGLASAIERFEALRAHIDDALVTTR